ncbi:YjiH family protein [Spartinivicinus poritis]|uniref:YjiH family protein n=1 Tax=Spartinivicinus poritis TaxID=2994640 RepID=A0ABT5UCW9_9GAMM|nr:YjiH family protein [Spartinivicinus sp. A2-2]MDE1464055.1 YjiH family protein [Spartinivicinus sp. A2-2]
MQEQVLSRNELFNLRNILVFVIPSLLGILLFMTPVAYQDGLTIPVAILAKSIKTALGDNATLLITCLVALSAIISLITKILKPTLITRNPFLNALFNESWFWLAMRFLGAVFIILVFLKTGSDILYSDATGGLVLNDLLPTLLSVFIFAGLLLPLLVNFGLLELLGTLLTVIMKPLFKLPGRSAIDCMTSWLGDGTVGILLTNQQYENRHYTQREATVIATTFSAVSISFSLIVIAQVKLEHLFLHFYLTVCLAGFVAAVIVPRLPPLSWKKDHYIDGSEKNKNEAIVPEGHTLISWGFEQALHKANSITSFKKVFMDGFNNVISLVFGLLPVIMAVGTLALVVAEHTPVFEWLGKPFLPYLELLQIPEAVAASKTIVVGFADMFIPSILAASIENEMTRFVIAAMSVTQLIYLSEVGALLLASRIPVSLWELFIVFLLRTLVTLPVIAGVAHLIF